MLTIVIPMGGEGRRFAEAGYTFPKPLIEIDRRPMIELVVDNLRPTEPHQFVFVCRKDHVDQYSLADVLKQISPGCRVVTMGGPTGGALCSVLLGLQAEDALKQLIVANADQIIDFSIAQFLADARERQADGSIVIFPSTHPKWSYVRLENELVVAAAEKRPISAHATAGLYYFQRVDEFAECAESMLLKNAALRTEFFVCPVYNEYVLRGRKVTVYPVPREAMHSLGTPEDVERYAARVSSVERGA